MFFRRRFGYESALYPRFTQDVNREFSLDVQVAASGFSKTMQKELEDYQEEIKGLSSNEEGSDDYDEEEDEEEEDEEDEKQNDIPSEMTEEEKLEQKLRNIRLGNTEPTTSEEEEEEEESDQEEEEEEEGEEEVLDEEAELARRGEKIEKLNNRDYKAHRDVKPKKTVKKSSTSAAVKEEELKSKVARTLKSKTNKQNVKNTRGNNLKNKGKRRDKAECRGGGIFD